MTETEQSLAYWLERKRKEAEELKKEGRENARRSQKRNL